MKKPTLFHIGSLIRSIRYFLGLWIRRRKYDLVFVYPDYFNRGEEGENIFISPFIEYCKKHHVTYQAFEQPGLVDGKRNADNIPLDFIYLLRSLLRRIMRTMYSSEKSIDEIDRKIARWLKAFFFNRLHFDMCIYMPDSMGIFFKQVSPDAKMYEYQHGIIFNGHSGYLYCGKVSKTMQAINSKLLVFGEGFKSLLISQDHTHFFSDENVICMGQSLFDTSHAKQKESGKTILFSSQISSFFTEEENKTLAQRINLFLQSNKQFFMGNGYRFIIKHHPRFNGIQHGVLNTDEAFVSIADPGATLETLLDQSAVHMTFSSTVAFDAAMKGVPTIFIESPLLPCDMFFEQYGYPYPRFRIGQTDHFSDIVSEFLEHPTQYTTCSQQVKHWAENYYQPFDEKMFQSLIDASKRK